MTQRSLFDSICAFIAAMALVRVIGGLAMVILGQWEAQEAIASVLYAWASIEAMAQVRKFVGS